MCETTAGPPTPIASILLERDAHVDVTNWYSNEKKSTYVVFEIIYFEGMSAEELGNVLDLLAICIISVVVSIECLQKGETEDQTRVYVDSTPTSQVEVKAVFIKCSHEGFQDQTQDSEELRFQREELHKHGTLTNCRQKVAITMKLTNDGKHTSEEYIPIEHVFEGPNKKHVLLLDPYVVRLRREPLLQAYKLRPLETVTGVFSKRVAKSRQSDINVDSKHLNRKQRHVKSHRRLSVSRWPKALFPKDFHTFELGHGPNGRQSFSVKVEKPFHLTHDNNTGKQDCGLVLYMNQTTFTQSVDLNKVCRSINPVSDAKVTVLSSPASPHTVKATIKTATQEKAMKRSKTTYHIMSQTCSLRNKSQHRPKRSEFNVIVQGNSLDTEPYVNKRLKERNKESDQRAHRTSTIDYKRYKQLEYTRDEQNQFTEREDDVTNRSFKDIDEVESKNIDSDDTIVKPQIKQTTSNKHYIDHMNIKKIKGDNGALHTKQKHGHSDHMKHKTEQFNNNESKQLVGNKGQRVVTIDKNEPVDNMSPIPPGITVSNIVKKLEHYDDEIEDEDEGRLYEIFEIGEPDIWYTVNLQMFQKQITPDGTTLWSDLTNGETASVSSLYRFWKSPDMTMRYKPINKIEPDDYTLPTKGLYLLAPKANTTDGKGDARSKEYIVVPMEDIVGHINVNKRDHNNTAHGNSTKKVKIRMSRAWMSEDQDEMKIIHQDKDSFLTFPFKKTLRSQIDIEAKADDNQLVRIGSSGLISIIVSDATRRSSTALSVEATNTGLAAANFRVQIRDCGGTSSTEDGDVTSSQIAMIPPHHNKRFTLHVNTPGDVSQCSVALVNDRDESVAVRDVSIKNGDRCFCVWHCQCTCLSDDPKLLCRDMSDAELLVAGLGGKDRPRPIRCCYYTNSVWMNILITIAGTIIMLFGLGFVKAILGLCHSSIGLCGLNRLIKLPRSIPHYYECSLSQRRVTYDSEGWPVHPDTKQRTVRVISYHMEFVLNLIYFVILPGVLSRDVWRKYRLKKVPKFCPGVDDTTNYYTSQDVQTAGSTASVRGSAAPLKTGLHDWMTPNADKVSKDLWTRMMDPAEREDEHIMHPILQTNRAETASRPEEHCSGNDTEQDDTEYVLMQMRKSRESLAKSQRKLDESPLLTPKKK